jgi:hypothetical protein
MPFPDLLTRDSDAPGAAEVERIRSNLVAHVAPLRSRTCWPKKAGKPGKLAQSIYSTVLVGRSSPAAILNGPSGHEIPKQLDWIGAERSRNRNKLDDVDSERELSAFRVQIATPGR